MPRKSHPDDDKVYACPKCDFAGKVYHRTHTNREYDHPYRCHKCGEEFDDPVERRARSSPPGETDNGIPPGLDEDMKDILRKRWSG